MARSPKLSDRRYAFDRIYFLAIFFGFSFFLILWLGFGRSRGPNAETHAKVQAVAVLKGTAGVNGTIYLTQEAFSTTTRITGKVQGLDPNSLRGFHIHTYGDLSDGCGSTGVHYNPFGKVHGGPTDSERHIGDLGNVQADGSGLADVDMVDFHVQLRGPWSVVGRAFVVHAGTDDLGKQDNEGSRTTGNAGGRSACGTIGLAPVAN